VILVTGATGTVGARVAHELVDRGAQVRAGVHARPLQLDGVESRVVDYGRPETLARALEGVRHVLLVLSLEFDGGTMLTVARRLLEAAAGAEVEHVVKLSAYGAGEEGYVHARWHRRVEREIESSGLGWTFLRPNAFMQNLVTDWGDSIRDDDAFSDAAGAARYAWVDARDIARVAANALTEPGHEGKAYELTGPEALTHSEVAETLSRVLGRTVRYVHLSDAELRRRLVEAGFSDTIAEAWVDVTAMRASTPAPSPHASRT
jgi:uncharacterized protein YbjT (DUF2867 family)